MSAVTEIAPLVGIVLACTMLAVARATHSGKSGPVPIQVVPSSCCVHAKVPEKSAWW